MFKYLYYLFKFQILASPYIIVQIFTEGMILEIFMVNKHLINNYLHGRKFRSHYFLLDEVRTQSWRTKMDGILSLSPRILIYFTESQYYR